MKKILISFIAALAMSAIGQTTYKWQYPTDILVPGTSSYTLFFNRSANNVPYIKKPDNTIQSLQSLMGLTPGAATWGSITGTVSNQSDLTAYILSNYWGKSGNAFGANSIFGTTDAYDILFKTNNTLRSTLKSNGHWLINSVFYDGSDVSSVSVPNRTLSSSSGATTIDWDNRLAIDATAVNSIDWGARKFYSPNGSSIFDYATNGKIGIGTSSPNHMLDVVGSGYTPSIQARSTNGGAYLRLTDDGTATSFIIGNEGSNCGIMFNEGIYNYFGSAFSGSKIWTRVNGTNGHWTFGEAGNTYSAPTTAKVNVIGDDQSASNYALIVADSTITEKLSVSNSGVTKVTGSFKYVDGNQGSGKILTSDASGNASWSSPSASTFTINGTGMSTGSSYTIQASTTNSLNIGTGLALSSGTAWNGATTNTLSLSASASNLTNGTTGTGSVVLSSGATLTTPTLGVASATSLSLTGAGGSGFLSLTTQTAQPSSPSSGTVLFSNSNSKLSWRGSGNTYMKTFDAGNNSADRVYSLPNRDAKIDSLTTSTSTALNGVIQGNGSVISAVSTVGTGSVPLQGALTSYTPTWTNGTIGNGTWDIKYIKTGKVVYVWGRLQTGSTTTYGSGSWSFTLPSTAESARRIGGSVVGFNSGVAIYGGNVQGTSTTTFQVTTQGNGNPWQYNTPGTWTGAGVSYIDFFITYSE